jgi:cytidine deaminase
MTDVELIALARGAALKAYAPYSRFHVGCAVESVDGQVVTGANMEIACYRLGLCAEQSALTGAITCTPCGGCRQAIYEAACLSGRDVEIVCSNGDGSAVERHEIGTLIPQGFGPANLNDAS